MQLSLVDLTRFFAEGIKSCFGLFILDLTVVSFSDQLNTCRLSQQHHTTRT